MKQIFKGGRLRSAVAVTMSLAALAGPTGPAGAQMSAIAPAQVAACFSPGGNCAAHITDAISGAKKQVRIQAMLFSIHAMQKAVIAAHNRGVDVAVILDPRQESRAGGLCTGQDVGGNPAINFARAGIPVFIDNPQKTAHNKLIVIDGELVIGGSFNYTYAADRENAENVTFIRSPAIAGEYLRYWNGRRTISHPFVAPACKH